MPVQQTTSGSRNVASSTPRAGNYPTTPTPTTKTQATTGKVTGADDGWISTVTQKAEASDNPDGYKYQAAVDLARQELGNEDNVDDRLFRETVDGYYTQMDPEASAEEMRGETPLTQGVRALAEGYDDVMTGIGGVLDAGVDGFATLLGYIPGLNNTAEWIKDKTTAENLKWIPDSLVTAGLSLIPYAGIPLAVGKSAIQNSDNIGEALTGRDSITGEELGGWQRLGKGGLSILDMGLSAIPGASAGKAAKSAATGAAKEGAKQVAEEGAKKGAGAAVKDLLTAGGNGALTTAVRNIKSGTPKLQAVKELTETAGKNIGANALAGSGSTVLGGTLGNMAVTDLNPLDAFLATDNRNIGLGAVQGVMPFMKMGYGRYPRLANAARAGQITSRTASENEQSMGRPGYYGQDLLQLIPTPEGEEA